MKPSPATAKITGFLAAEKRYNQEHGIWPKNIAVIDRLLECGDSLESAWAEILKAAHQGKPYGSEWERWQFVIDRIITTAAPFQGDKTRKDSPNEIDEGRNALGRVAKLNAEIAVCAAKLADLMRKRATVAACGDIALPNDSDPINLMERAAELGELADPHTRCHLPYLFRSNIKPGLEALQARYDWKYWPATAELLEAIAEEQHQVDPAPRNRILASAAQVRQTSSREFMRTFDDALHDLDRHYMTGCNTLSAATYATICNAVLGLDGEITPQSVNTYRTHERDRRANATDK